MLLAKTTADWKKVTNAFYTKHSSIYIHWDHEKRAKQGIALLFVGNAI